MQKKVLQLVHNLSMGGAETLVKAYALNLDKSRYEVTVLCFNHDNNSRIYEQMLEAAGINIICVDDHLMKIPLLPVWVQRAIYGLERFFLIRKFIRSINPDILHTHLTINFYVKFARPIGSLCIVHTIHNEPQKLWFSGGLRRKKDFADAKWLVKHYGMRFITLHEGMRQEVNRLFGVSNSIILNNGIDFARFENVRHRKDMRRSLGIPEDAFVIGHVGRFTWQKNHKFLVKVFLEFRKMKKNAYLLMVGDGGLKWDIQHQLKEEGACDCSQILSNRKDVPDLLNVMDFFVFPSAYEGLGIAVIEAQKMGLPCLISDTIPAAVSISSLVAAMSVNEGAVKWAEYIIKYQKKEPIYYDIESWDMKNIVKRLQMIYEGEI